MVTVAVHAKTIFQKPFVWTQVYWSITWYFPSIDKYQNYKLQTKIGIMAMSFPCFFAFAVSNMVKSTANSCLCLMCHFAYPSLFRNGGKHDCSLLSTPFPPLLTSWLEFFTGFVPDLDYHPKCHVKFFDPRAPHDNISTHNQRSRHVLSVILSWSVILLYYYQCTHWIQTLKPFPSMLHSPRSWQDQLHGPSE